MSLYETLPSLGGEQGGSGDEGGEKLKSAASATGDDEEGASAICRSSKVSIELLSIQTLNLSVQALIERVDRLQGILSYWAGGTYETIWMYSSSLREC